MTSAISTPHAITPADIVAFWRAAGPERWFEKDDAFDAEIRRRFLSTWEVAAAGGLSGWEDNDEGALALILVLDQFPRNIFRDDPRAYATDAAALATAKRAIARGVDHRIDLQLRPFIYMPLMHSEHLTDQESCVGLFRRHGDPNNLKYAELHEDIIRRFGRFPHRNAVLGRTTTTDEQAFLGNGGFAG